MLAAVLGFGWLAQATMSRRSLTVNQYEEYRAKSFAVGKCNFFPRTGNRRLARQTLPAFYPQSDHRASIRISVCAETLFALFRL